MGIVHDGPTYHPCTVSHHSVVPLFWCLVEESHSTLPILGGGAHVEFSMYDKSEWTFLLGDDIDALRRKYLKIAVWDYETGSADRYGIYHKLCCILLNLLSVHIDTYPHDGRIHITICPYSSLHSVFIIISVRIDTE